MAVAASEGHVELMGDIYGTFQCLIDEIMAREAVRGGSCDVLRWLHTKLAAPATDCEQQGAGEEPAYTPVYTRAEMLQFLSRDLLDVAAKNGDLEMLQTLLELMRGHFASMQEYRGVALHAAQVATRYGRMDILDWLRPRFLLPSEAQLGNEAHRGPFDDEALLYAECTMCQEATTDKSCTAWRMDNAASLGRFDDVLWFHEHRSEHGCSIIAMDAAAAHGHFEVVRWLHENRSEGCTYEVFEHAVQNGHLDVGLFLVESRNEAAFSRGLSGTVKRAAGEGHLDIIKYLLANGTMEILGDALCAAAAGGHLDVVKWLLEYASMEKDADIVAWSQPIKSAARNDHLDVVRYLFPYSSQQDVICGIQEAASKNHEGMVRWLADSLGWSRSDESPTEARSHIYDAETLAQAINDVAVSGNLKLTRYLYELIASKRRVLEPLASARVQLQLRFAVVSTAAAGNLQVVKWLIDAEFREGSRDVLTETYRWAVRGARLSVVRWISSHPALLQLIQSPGLHWSDLNEGLINATRRSDFAMLEWICPRMNAFHSALYEAIELRSIEIIQWLVGETFQGGGTKEWTMDADGRSEYVECAKEGQAWCFQNDSPAREAPTTSVANLVNQE